MGGSRLRGSERLSRTPITQRGLKVSPRSFVSKPSPSATTGRWSGVGAGWTSPLPWVEFTAERVPTSVRLAKLISPGVCSVLRIITVFITTTSVWKSLPLRLAHRGLEFTWTGRVGPCRSIVCSLGASDTFTPSTTTSLSPSTLALGWRRMTARSFFVQCRTWEN